MKTPEQIADLLLDAVIAEHAKITGSMPKVVPFQLVKLLLVSAIKMDRGSG